MNTILNRTFDEERALYASDELELKNCRFEGPADGESALKESRNISAYNCLFDLRYPLWHCNGIYARNCNFTQNCRAAIWYTDFITLEGCTMNGIKALRECSAISMENCEISSPEFGWFSHRISMESCKAESEYFMMKCSDMNLKNFSLKGKYSFQYLENAEFDNCSLDTKDAFWHCNNITVRNSTIKGEYLAWYSDGLTLENCEITGTQPFCYCKNLRLINCSMKNADLCFEKSDVTATLTEPLISIKNAYSGSITLPSAGKVITDDPNAKAKIIFR